MRRLVGAPIGGLRWGRVPNWSFARRGKQDTATAVYANR